MIESIKSWILTVSATAILLGIIDMLVPSGAMKRTVEVVSGFVLCAAIIFPLIGIVSDLKNTGFENGLLSSTIEEDISSERNEIIDSRNDYTEEQIIQAAQVYKYNVNRYIDNVLNSMPEVGNAECSVIINEDYNSDEFGIIERVYVEVKEYKAEDKAEPNTDNKKSFGSVERIEKIEISLDGIKVNKTGDENKVDEKEDGEEMKNQIKDKIINSLSAELKIAKESVYVK